MVAKPMSLIARHMLSEPLLASRLVKGELFSLLGSGFSKFGLVTINFQVHETISLVEEVEELRSLIRKSDQIIWHDRTVYFVLRGANRQGALLVQSRLWERLLWYTHTRVCDDGGREPIFSSGVGAYPFPSKSVDLLLDAVDSVSLRHGQPGRPKEHELTMLARSLGVPYLSSLPKALPQQIRRLVSLQLALELRCCPLGREKDVLTVAMCDPQDHAALDRLTLVTGLKIFPVLADPEVLKMIQEQLI